MLARCIAQSRIGKMAIDPAQIESINEILCLKRLDCQGARDRGAPHSAGVIISVGPGGDEGWRATAQALCRRRRSSRYPASPR
jgi:citrate lyase beta subunit